MLLGIVVDIGIGGPFGVADEQAAIAGDMGGADDTCGASTNRQAARALIFISLSPILSSGG